MFFGKKHLADVDNRVIINCGGVRHETYKVNSRTKDNIILNNLSQDDIEEDTSYKIVQIN